jgi:hypothetical protein
MFRLGPGLAWTDAQFHPTGQASTSTALALVQASGHDWFLTDESPANSHAPLPTPCCGGGRSPGLLTPGLQGGVSSGV